MTKRIVWIALFVGGLGLLIAWVVKLQSAGSARASKTLANGDILTLEQVTFGKNHVLGDDRTLTARLTRLLPPAWRNRFPNQGAIQFSSSEDQLVCWLTLRDGQGKYLSPSFGNIHVLDEHGCLFHTLNSGTYGGMNILACPVKLHSFPRRQTEFTLRVFDWTNKLLAEFKVRNPVVVRDPPSWTPQPLPITRTNGDLTITLNRVKYASDPNYLLIDPAFSVTQKGRSTGDWSVHQNVWSDVTGNDTDYGDGLCRREKAWKLQTKLFRNVRAAFASNEVWSLPGRPVMSPGSVTNLIGTNRLNGARLELYSLAGPGSYGFSNNVVTRAVPLAPGQQSGSFSSSSSGTGTNRVETIQLSLDTSFVAVRVADVGDKQRLSVRMIDQNGTAHEAMMRGGCNGVEFFGAKLPSNVTHVTVEFIVQNAREAEFIVAPPAN